MSSITKYILFVFCSVKITVDRKFYYSDTFHSTVEFILPPVNRHKLAVISSQLHGIGHRSRYTKTEWVYSCLNTFRIKAREYLPAMVLIKEGKSTGEQSSAVSEMVRAMVKGMPFS